MTYATAKFMWSPKIPTRFMYLMKRDNHFLLSDPMEPGNGQFKNPYGIASGYDGDDLEIFVTDPDTDRVQVFDENGTYKGNSGQWMEIRGELWLMTTDRFMFQIKLTGLMYSTKRVLYYAPSRAFPGIPWGLSIHAKRLAVGNSSGSHDFVRIYDLNGTFIKQFGTDGSGEWTIQTAIWGGIDPNGELWVADYYNHRVQIFDGNGSYIRRVEDGRYSPVTTRPEQLLPILIYDLDSYYISDSGNNRVVVES